MPQDQNQKPPKSSPSSAKPPKTTPPGPKNPPPPIHHQTAEIPFKISSRKNESVPSADDDHEIAPATPAKNPEPKPHQDTPAPACAVNPHNLILEQQNSRWKMLVGFLIFIVVLGGLYFFFRPRPNQSTPENPLSSVAPAEKATLAGTVVYSGLIPASSSQARIGIFLRPSGSLEEFTDTGLRLDLQATDWQYDGAAAGQNYDIQAILFLDGASAANSEVTTVTAPALSVTSVLNLDQQTLGQVPAEVPRTISGMVEINGYLPEDSTISIISHEQDINGRLREVPVYNFAADSEIMYYTLSGADPTRTYLFSAALTSGRRDLGYSQQQLTARVYDRTINFTINSTATPPNSSFSSRFTNQAPIISGQITVNGPLRNNTRLLVMGKKSDEDNFQVWQALTDLSNSRLPWSYAHVTSGQTYDVQVVLQVNNENISVSRTRTIAAPSTSASFTVNTNFSLATPDDSKLPRVEPCTRDADAWVTYVVIPETSHAQQYWVTANSRTYDQIVPAAGGDTRVRITNLPGGRNSVRYAYSFCRQCTDPQNFSSWSRSVTFTCE